MGTYENDVLKQEIDPRQCVETIQEGPKLE